MMMKHITNDTTGNRVAKAGVDEESQSFTASTEQRGLTANLMEQICDRGNLNRAYKRVKANKGAAGVDGMKVDQLFGWIKEHKQELIAALLDGSYKPKEVLAVEIPKPTGGMRQLGIPTVVDRLVQQAILQVLEPLLDPTFSQSSYGFRPGKGAHQALKKASEHVAEGRTTVVDIDLEKFFDRVNHDILMSRLARRIEDKRLLKIIRSFLEAGMMKNGVAVERYEGTPQGGPLSPMLSNLLLDDLDKELEKRGHKFCRYADDCNIYVRTKRAGDRVMESIRRFLEQRLKLKVNQQKSSVAEVEERKFLGYRILNDGRLIIAPESIQRVKAKIRQLTKRNRANSISQVIARLNSTLSGWVTYFKETKYQAQMREIDEWMRHRMRSLCLKQKKRPKPIADFLQLLGSRPTDAWKIAKSGKGWWRLSATKQAQIAMNNAWFDQLGLISLDSRFKRLNS